MEQQPAAEPAIHEVAKPVARTLAWGLFGAACAALAAGSIRNLRGTS